MDEIEDGEWTRVVEPGEMDMVHLVRDAVTPSSSTYERLWLRTEYLTRVPEGSLSVRLLGEFDCAEWRVRWLSSVGFTEHNLQGDSLLSDDSVGDWVFVAPDTLGDEVARHACQ